MSLAAQQWSWPDCFKHLCKYLINFKKDGLAVLYWDEMFQ